MIPNTIQIDEHLEEGAPIQLHLSRTHCSDDCAWYHGPRQYLRVLGVAIGIGRDSEFLVNTLADIAKRGGFERVLIPASADCGTLAHVVAAYKDAGAPVRVTFADRCATPVGINTWFAGLHHVPIETHHTDVFDLTLSAPVDVVCVHAFFGWFDPPARRQLLRKWHSLLRPGGLLITAHSMRARETLPTVQIMGNERRAIMTRASRARNDARDRFGIQHDIFDRWAEDFTRRKAHHPIPSEGEVRELLESTGFRLQQLFTVDGRTSDDPRRVRLVAERI